MQVKRHHELDGTKVLQPAKPRMRQGRDTSSSPLAWWNEWHFILTPPLPIEAVVKCHLHRTGDSTMARLADLGESEEVEPGAEAGGEASADDDGDSRTNPNMGRFSAALTCYP